MSLLTDPRPILTEVRDNFKTISPIIGIPANGTSYSEEFISSGLISFIVESNTSIFTGWKFEIVSGYGQKEIVEANFNIRNLATTSDSLGKNQWFISLDKTLELKKYRLKVTSASLNVHSLNSILLIKSVTDDSDENWMYYLNVISTEKEIILNNQSIAPSSTHSFTYEINNYFRHLPFFIAEITGSDGRALIEVEYLTLQSGNAIFKDIYTINNLASTGFKSIKIKNRGVRFLKISITNKSSNSANTYSVSFLKRTETESRFSPSKTIYLEKNLANTEFLPGFNTFLIKPDDGCIAKLISLNFELITTGITQPSANVEIYISVGSNRFTNRGISLLRSNGLGNITFYHGEITAGAGDWEFQSIPKERQLAWLDNVFFSSETPLRIDIRNRHASQSMFTAATGQFMHVTFIQELTNFSGSNMNATSGKIEKI
jgi:hypothetical protein